MKTLNPLLLVDFYKIHHNRMYPQGMVQLYSNFTPRKSRIEGIDGVIVFGVQYLIQKYLIDQFNENFFNRPWSEVEEEYTKHTGLKNTEIAHIQKLHGLGFLPITVKSLPEGTKCPIGVPMLTIRISDSAAYGEHSWLVNYLETLISTVLWQPITSATIANEYRKLLEGFAKKTTSSIEGVQWQGHDFSMRGMSSPESAVVSAMGHLTSFTGSDTIPAIYELEAYYGATGLIGASVPATEHSVMCMGQKESEIETFRRLLNIYPTGILSVVSDTWDLWKVCTEYLPQLKEEILARDGKLVIRPDSGDPVDIICGKSVIFSKELSDNNVQAFAAGKTGHKYFTKDGLFYNLWKESTDEESPYLWNVTAENLSSHKGVIELLWEAFGGTVNEQGYKVLDSHIGAIYGDSITPERAKKICERLEAKGFASTNIVFGIGSYTYQYNTRDTFGFAMKATYGEVMEFHQYVGEAEGYMAPVAREIFKDPITDDGTKKSKKGLLAVFKSNEQERKNGMPHLLAIDQANWGMEGRGELKKVFENGEVLTAVTLQTIRERIINND